MRGRLPRLRATTAGLPRARTSAHGCRAASRAPGSSASSGASRRSASPRAGSRTGRPRPGGPCPRGSARRHRATDRRGDEPRQPPEPRTQLAARRLADQGAALVGVRAREEPVERHVRVAVVRIAVREGELRGLGHDVHELRLAQRGDVEAFEQAQLLEPGRALPPRRRLAHRQPAVVDGRGRLERRAPARQVVPGEEAFVLAREPVDLLGDEALVVDAPRALDRPVGLVRAGGATSRRAAGCGRSSRAAAPAGRGRPTPATRAAAARRARSSP